MFRGKLISLGVPAGLPVESDLLPDSGGGSLVESSQLVQSLLPDERADAGDTVEHLVGSGGSVVHLHSGVEVTALGVLLGLGLLVVALVLLQYGVLSLELLASL